MTILEQLTSSFFTNDLTAGEFRDLLNSNDISYYQGWDDDDFIFYLLDEPDTWFLFSDVEGYSIGVVEFQD
jgi:hypothetical protein